YPFTKFFIEFEIQGGHCASITAPPIRLSPRMAALEVSLAAVACGRSAMGGDVERLESAASRYGAARPGGEATRGAVVSHARVFLLRIGRGEKIEEPGRGTSPAPAIPARAMMSPAAERRSGRQGLSKDARGRYSRFEFLIALPQRKKGDEALAWWSRNRCS